MKKLFLLTVRTTEESIAIEAESQFEARAIAYSKMKTKIWLWARKTSCEIVPQNAA